MNKLSFIYIYAWFEIDFTYLEINLNFLELTCLVR